MIKLQAMFPPTIFFLFSPRQASEGGSDEANRERQWVENRRLAVLHRRKTSVAPTSFGPALGEAGAEESLGAGPVDGLSLEPLLVGR